MMRKIVLAVGFLAVSLMATDFSQLTTEELTALRGTVAVEDRADFRVEMQSRMATMTPDEQLAFRNSRQGTGVGGQGQMGMNRPSFSDFDVDNDGTISQAELETGRADRVAKHLDEGRLAQNIANAPEFATLDTNGDGAVDTTEFQTHQTAQMAEHVNSMGQGHKQGGGMGQGMGRGRQ